MMQTYTPDICITFLYFDLFAVSVILVHGHARYVPI